MIFPKEALPASAELEAALISTIAFLPAWIMHILLCRFAGSTKGVLWMFVSFVAYFGALTVLYFPFEPSLEIWMIVYSTAGFWALSYMEVFSMLCRGFSLSILVHLSERPGDSLNSVVQNYGGVGAAGLMEKRLSGLERLGFIARDAASLRLKSAAGRIIAAWTYVYKRVLRMGMGG
jgi:hypothetical protein